MIQKNLMKLQEELQLVVISSPKQMVMSQFQIGFLKKDLNIGSVAKN